MSFKLIFAFQARFRIKPKDIKKVFFFLIAAYIDQTLVLIKKNTQAISFFIKRNQKCFSKNLSLIFSLIISGT
jgi:hypothetical protein